MYKDPQKQKDAARKYYESNKEKFLESSKNCKRRTRQMIRDIKIESGCIDCKKSFPHYILEFDHIRGIKEFSIADGHRYARHKVLKEIEKCDIVCANCHRIRTWNRSSYNNEG